MVSTRTLIPTAAVALSIATVALTTTTPADAAAPAGRSVTATVSAPAAAFATALVASIASPTASPPGVNPASCTPSKAHPWPVVLVNGTFTVMQDSFDYLGPKLATAGYCVYGYNYGADGRSPVQALGPVADGVTALATEVTKVEHATHTTKVDLVGYSQGGLITEIYTKFGGKQNVHSVTALAPTTHGTTLLGLATLAATIPGALPLLSAGGCPACADQVRGSAIVTKLDTGPIAVKGIPYTVIDTTLEDVVTPTGSSFIDEPGVVNEYVQQHATLDIEDHVTLPFDPTTASLTLAALKRAGS